VAEELKVSKASVPKAVKDVRQLNKEGKKPDARQLREAVDAMGELMRKKIEVRIKAIREDMEEARGKGADVTVSKDLLMKAEAQLSEGKWRGAANCVMEAERSIGVAEQEQRQYIAQRTKVEASIENARRNGLELSETIRLYREAERVKSQDHPAAVKLMNEAMDASDKAVEEFLPDIQVDLDFEGQLEPGKWCKARLNLSNGAKAMAREVSVVIAGDMDMRGFTTLAKLRGGERKSVEVEVRPKAAGTVKVTLSLECKPVLSNDKVGYDSEFEVEV
jgi:hypothetical protein